MLRTFGFYLWAHCYWASISKHPTIFDVNSWRSCCQVWWPLFPGPQIFDRLSYFRLIESCIGEIVFHKTGVDPDFSPNTKFHFETTVADMIDQLTDTGITRKLEQTVLAKQEAIAMQSQYWEKLTEFRKEAEQLRKHVSFMHVSFTFYLDFRSSYSFTTKNWM